MELTFLSVFKLYLGIVAGTLGILSFVTMKWLLRLRIVAVMGIGVFLLAFVAGPIVTPKIPLGTVTLYQNDISFLQVITCLVLAFLTGLVSFFVAGNDGRAIGPLAVPAGLAVWAMKTGNMTSLLLTNHTLPQRQAVYGTLKWEAFFWLLLVLAGYFGVITASLLPVGKSDRTATNGILAFKPNTNKILSMVVAVIAAVVIGQLGIAMFAQDVKLFDSQLGSVIGQVSMPQIGFAVIVAFAIAGFVAKKFLDVDHLVVVIATAVTAFVAIMISSKPDVLEHMTKFWPVHFYPRSSGCILPIQYVAFGAFGAITGYWAAVKTSHGHKEAKN